MKIAKIVNCLPIITKVYDSIDDFKRTFSLLDSYNELKSIVEIFEKKRENIIKDFKAGTAKDLTPEQLEEGNKKLGEYAEQDIELKQVLIQFTKPEIEKSKIKGSEISQIMPFIKLS
jgi:hypothetical protein